MTVKKKPKADKWDGPAALPRETANELHALARDIVTGRVYLGKDDDDLRLCFMPLSLGGLAGAPRSYLESIGMVYEYIEKALPRSINGKPMFWSCKFVQVDDWKIVIEDVLRMQAALS